MSPRNFYLYIEIDPQATKQLTKQIRRLSLDDKYWNIDFNFLLESLKNGRYQRW